MNKKEKKIPVITDATKRFNEAVEMLISKGNAANYKEIADAINWNESGMSTARKGEINVPGKYINALQEVYKIKIVTEVEDQIFSKIIDRLIHLEAHAEVFESVCAELNAKANKISFTASVGELRSMAEAAYKRRLGLEGK